MARTAMVQVPYGAVSGTRSTSPAQTIPSPAGDFHLPSIQYVQAARLDVVRDAFREQSFSARAAGFLAQSHGLQRVMFTTVVGRLLYLAYRETE